MNRTFILLLRLIILLIGLAGAAFLIWEPQVEGRNEGATQFQIYFNDPFLAYAYVASLPFFVGVWQAFKVVGYAGQKPFPQAGVKALRTIKFCALAIVAFVVGAEIIIWNNTSDDRAGGVFIGGLIAIASIVTAAAAAMLERVSRKAA